MTRDLERGPRVQADLIAGTYTPTCEKCHYEGPSLRSKETAESLLRRHVETRLHKTNTAGPTRFIV